MVEATENGAPDFYNIPTTYSLNGQLISLIVNHYIWKGGADIWKKDVETLKKEVEEIIESKIKATITEIVVEIKEDMVSGRVSFVGGNPIGFEFRNINFTAIKNEN